MITQAAVYAYLASETDLTHDLRMDVIEAMFEEHTKDERGGYKLTGHREWRKTPLCDMLNRTSSIASGFKVMEMGGDSDSDESHLHKMPSAQLYSVLV